MSTVLIVDDEKNIRQSLGVSFRLEGYEVKTAENGREALEALERGGVDLIVLDLQMPELDGMETLAELRRREHDVPVMMLTAHASIERAVEATRLGAFDFVEKPPHAEKILLTARNALRQHRLEAENAELRAEAAPGDEMIGDAPPMVTLKEQIGRVAPTAARVLVLGENGTGKELVARALHRQSERSGGPFVKVNCAAIPRDLFESELFGHERGAFTGATARRAGKMRRAEGGTLFLDEIGEIPLELQPKLLRAIETGEFEPVGSDQEVTVDVRVIAATNRDLAKAVADGRFREDLYYRLQVVTLTVPPLRERLDDLPALVDHFLEATSQENKLPPRTIDDDAVERLRRHRWPGNVRELRNLVERVVILGRDERIDAAAVEAALPAPAEADAPPPANLKDALHAFERRQVLAALERNRWRMTATARELGLERSHLYKKLKALGIERPED